MKHIEQHYTVYILLATASLWMLVTPVAATTPLNPPDSPQVQQALDLRAEQSAYILPERDGKSFEFHLAPLGLFLHPASTEKTPTVGHAREHHVLHDSVFLSRHLLYTQATSSSL